MTRLSRLTAAVVVAAALTLTGCAAGGASDGTTTDGSGDSGVSAATGERITGDGYAFSVPEGWGIPEGSDVEGIDVLVADLGDTDGFADNVNVLQSPAGLVDAELIETAGLSELEGAGVVDATVNDRVDIGGSESPHLSGMASAAQGEYFIDQYYPSDDTVTYVVTFSFSPDVSAADRAAVTGSVLASWSWE